MNDDERKRQEEIDQVEARLAEEGRAAAMLALEQTPEGTARVTATAAWTGADDERQRHEISVTAFRQPSDRPAVLTLSTRVIRPSGKPKAEGEIHTIASRLASKKATGFAGILWMDLCDPDWHVGINHVRPAMLEWKELPLATTPGIWHAFYGQKGRTLMMERAAPSLGFGRKHTDTSVQLFDGRLRQEEQRCWSAAILRCIDGIAIFENPNPKTWLPFRVLRELVGLEGYNPDASFHRFDEGDREGLRTRLEDVERRLDFYVG